MGHVLTIFGFFLMMRYSSSNGHERVATLSSSSLCVWDLLTVGSFLFCDRDFISNSVYFTVLVSFRFVKPQRK